MRFSGHLHRAGFAVLAAALLFGASASADTICSGSEVYCSDFSDYVGDWFDTATLTAIQNPDSVTLTGGDGFNAAEARALYTPLPGASAHLMLDVVSTAPTLNLRILYYDADDNWLGNTENDLVLPNGSIANGLNTVQVFGGAFDPPVDAASFRLQIRVGNGDSATLNHVEIVMPEPGTLALVASGLLLLSARGRRRA